MKIFENTGIQVGRRNVIILLGGPGAGKGTQAENICAWLKIPHISSGQLLRSEVTVGTPLGLRAKAIIDAGDLVGDDLVNELILQRIRRPDCSTGFVLDGYPRNAGQAVTLESSLPLWDRQIVIEILTDLERMVPRLTNRRTCNACGAIYHLISSPPKMPDVCDHCKGALIQRSDDREDVIRERFKAYQEMTAKVSRLYQRMYVYHGVDGMRPPDQVANDIRQVIEEQIYGLSATARVAAD